MEAMDLIKLTLFKIARPLEIVLRKNIQHGVNNVINLDTVFRHDKNLILIKVKIIFVRLQ